MGRACLHFVQLCTRDSLPRPGSLGEYTVESRQICLANDEGRLAAVDNVCPHRQGPLAEGWIENGRVLCPWHAWAFDLGSGQADHDPGEVIEVFPVRIEGDDFLIGLPD